MKNLENQSKWVLGVTGASGMRYALRLLQILCRSCAEVNVVFSDAALRVLWEEEDVKVSHGALSTEILIGETHSNCTFHNPKDIGAAIASGSRTFSGMVIAPCTTGTLGAIANGVCGNLIHRAAEVTLKEGRALVIVPRETPFSAIQLENMLKLSRLGVSIVPAMPGFYHKPRTIDDLVDMMVMKILDQMGFNLDLVQRWGEAQKSANLIPLPLPQPRRDVLTLDRMISERETA